MTIDSLVMLFVVLGLIVAIALPVLLIIEEVYGIALLEDLSNYIDKLQQ